MCVTDRAMTRLVAILVTLFLVAIPAKADVALWPHPVPGWTVIQVYGEIKQGDLATFERYTENVDPAATLVIVTGPGGNLSAGIDMGRRVHLKKLIVGVSPEEADRRSNGQVRFAMRPDMDRWRNRA
jgi:hypothetical protein